MMALALILAVLVPAGLILGIVVHNRSRGGGGRPGPGDHGGVAYFGSDSSSSWGSDDSSCDGGSSGDCGGSSDGGGGGCD
jgi:hypothetical protein